MEKGAFPLKGESAIDLESTYLKLNGIRLLKPPIFLESSLMHRSYFSLAMDILVC